ncbi:MAG: DUF1292 domain-containing protein [Clostridiales bacterium]|nr:DUF1292 domain-containing protein [Clostridiales bacterium]
MAEERDILENELITLVDEDGIEHNFEMLDVIELDGFQYAVLQPEDEDPDDDEEPEAIILKIETDENGEEILVDIEDDDEWEKVADAWQDILEAEDTGD